MHDFALLLSPDGPLLAGSVVTPQIQPDGGDFLGIFEALAAQGGDTLPQPIPQSHIATADGLPEITRVASIAEPVRAAIGPQAPDVFHPFRHAVLATMETGYDARGRSPRIAPESAGGEPNTLPVEAIASLPAEMAPLPVATAPPPVPRDADKDDAGSIAGIVTQTPPHTAPAAPESGEADPESDTDIDIDTEIDTDTGAETDHVALPVPERSERPVIPPDIGPPPQVAPPRIATVSPTAREVPALDSAPRAAAPSPRDRQEPAPRDVSSQPSPGRATTPPAPVDEPPPPPVTATSVEPASSGDPPPQAPPIPEENPRHEMARGEPPSDRPRADAPFQLHRTTPPLTHGRDHVRIAQGGDGSMQLSLGDDDIGMIELQVHETSTGLRIDVAAERPESLDIARRQVLDMQRDLRLNGYGDVSFTFDGERRPQQSGRDPGPAGGEAAPEGDATFFVSPGEPASAPPGATGLDLRL